MRIKEKQKKIECQTYLLIGFILTFFIIFLGCASNDKSHIQRLEKNAIPSASNKFPDEIFDRKLPEMTSDEYERLGDTLLSKGKLHIAYLQYERSLKANPDNLRVKYKKGLALLMGKKSDEAIMQFKIVLERDPVLI